MSSPLAPLFDLRAVWFVLFYVVLAVVFVLKDRYPLRRPFLVGFFCLLCLATLAGTPFLPFVGWDKFPTTYPETETEYELRVVTETGRELTYDIRATLGADGVNEQYLMTQMVEERSRCENVATLDYLLERARGYKTRVERRSIPVFARFPPHGLTDIWSKKEMRETSEFTEIRLYEREVRSSDDGTRVESTSEKLLLEYSERDKRGCPEISVPGVSF